jgi:hypothetical protein
MKGPAAYLRQKCAKHGLHLQWISKAYGEPEGNTYLSSIRNFFVDGTNASLDLERIAERVKVLLQHRFCPVKVGRVEEVVAVEDQALAKPEQLAEFHYERSSTHARLARRLQGEGKTGHRREMIFEPDFKDGEGCRARKCL